MGLFLAIGFIGFLALIVFGAPLFAMIEMARIAGQEQSCPHTNAAGGLFCPDCGGRVGRAKRAKEPVEVPAQVAPPPTQVEQPQATPARDSAITEALLRDLAGGLKDLGYDKSTIKLKCAQLRPMAEGGADLNKLINEALKK